MIKHLALSRALVVGVFLLVSSLSFAGEEKMGGNEATITGRVVDPAG